MTENKFPNVDADSNPVDEYMRWLYVGSEINDIQKKRIDVLKNKWSNGVNIK